MVAIIRYCTYAGSLLSSAQYTRGSIVALFACLLTNGRGKDTVEKLENTKQSLSFRGVILYCHELKLNSLCSFSDFSLILFCFMKYSFSLIYWCFSSPAVSSVFLIIPSLTSWSFLCLAFTCCSFFNHLQFCLFSLWLASFSVDSQSYRIPLV